ncbi:hypothetical protein [Hyphomicrobium sp. DY-1]|uniref:hypothetical protein n=1 Tax=Hyphomicrobium sp. DY-1 TaxID=3075650 RepID=UPI0039C0A76A
MSTFNYSKTAASAAKLIKKFGQHGAIRRLVPGNGPPYDPGPSTPVEFAADLVIVDYTISERDGTLILATDKRAYVSALGLKTTEGVPLDEIKPTDKLVEASGKVWTIILSKPLNPAGVIVLYDLQIRAS